MNTIIERTGASFARHRSEQTVETPEDFLRAVEARFGSLAVDLAATDENKKAPDFIGPDANSLETDWGSLEGNLWLNPPFGNLAPWAAKCAGRRNDARWTLLLAPASSDSRWFQECVAPYAHVLDLMGRLTFVGHAHVYPKGLILAAFGFGMVGRSAWYWRSSVPQEPVF